SASGGASGGSRAAERIGAFQQNKVADGARGPRAERRTRLDHHVDAIHTRRGPEQVNPVDGLAPDTGGGDPGRPVELRGRDLRGRAERVPRPVRRTGVRPGEREPDADPGTDIRVNTGEAVRGVPDLEEEHVRGHAGPNLTL